MTRAKGTSAHVSTTAAKEEMVIDAEETAAAAAPADSAAPGNLVAPPKQTLGEKITARISRLSTRNNFWHRFFSWIYLPIAFKSGIKMKKLDSQTFAAVLPFRRFNKNFYNAMAGASLLANAEIAGGLYIFSYAGEEYTVVCKELHYKFLRPCFGPAVYKVLPKADIDALMQTKKEFNFEMVLNVFQQIKKPGSKEPRVGRVKAVFHLTPKTHVKERALRKRMANARRKAAERDAKH